MRLGRYPKLLVAAGASAVIAVGAFFFVTNTRADAHELVSSLRGPGASEHLLTPDKLEALSHQLQGQGTILDEESVRLAAVGELSWHFVAVDHQEAPCLLSMIGDADDYVLAGTCGSVEELTERGVTLSAEMPSGVSTAVLVPDDHELATGKSMTMDPGANVAFAEATDPAELPDAASFRSASGKTLEVSLPLPASEAGRRNQ